MAKFETLKEQLADTIARDERRPPHSYIGADWYQYTDAEREVFHFEAARWPRMIGTHDCYLSFKGIKHEGFDRALVNKARKEHPEWNASREGTPMTDMAEFSAFAAEMSGLKEREAWAAYYKYSFWLIRNGLWMAD